MIKFRQQNFSEKDMGKIINDLTGKLSRDRLDDYEIIDTDTSLPTDSVSVYPDPDNLKIYIPEDLDYAQYEIDDFLRVTVKYLRVSTDYDRKFYIMSLSGGRLQKDQLYKLVKFIIQNEDFCTILENERNK